MFLVMGAASLPAAVVVARERRKRWVVKRIILVATVTAGLVAGATIV